MKWGMTTAQRRTWHPFFPLFPRHLTNGRWAWLTAIWRCEQTYQGMCGDEGYWSYKEFNR